VVTNIPNPYRLHLFRCLHREFLVQGVDFRVLFMAETEPGRFWELAPGEFGFPFKIARGAHVRLGDAVFHFNPAIICDTLWHRPAWLIVGGSWAHPTSFGLAGLSRLPPRRSTILFWSEANPSSTRWHSGPVALLRRRILSCADGFVVPGSIAEQTVRSIVPAADKRFLHLPNLVDETLYDSAVAQLRLRRSELRAAFGASDRELVLLWPARLHEPTKGILSFLRTTRNQITPEVMILLAGEGPDRAAVEAWLRDHHLPQVKLLGHRSESDMLTLLASADALILPSLKDCNPLVVIEGLWAGLPLLISDRCGNWPEALHPGVNGWLVDPDSPQTVSSAFSSLLACSRHTLERMGAASRDIAVQRFSSRSCVRAFVTNLIGFQRC
jgi:glycosyltransferase involved in cell wall biosynthesis